MPAWTHRTLLNAADITALTAGGTTVDEGESVSHVCDVVYYPAAGVQDSDGLIGQTLVIDLDTGSGWATLFSGRVIRAEWDQRERLYRLRGSNRLQEHFRAMGSTANVLAALPGAVHTDALFGEPPDDLWEYAQQCMSTIEQDVHLDRAGALVLIDWAAKGTADVILGGDAIHNQGAFSLRRPDLDETTNQVTVVYQYRVERWKIRAHSINWSAWQNDTPIVDWCSWFAGPAAGYQFPPLLIDLAQSVLLGSSWAVAGGIQYTTYPPGASDMCGSDIIWVAPEGPDRFAFSASADGLRAWGQPITETYTLTVVATAAQALYGTTVTATRSGSTSVEADQSWPPAEAPTPPGGWSQDSIGDYYQDQEDEPLRANDIQAGYQWASRYIRSAQRATSLTVRTDIDPAITLSNTVEVVGYDLQARGKVRQIRSVLSSTAPHMELSLALSRGGGGTTDSWSVPTRPDTSDPGYPAPPSSTAIGTYVGGTPDSPVAPVPDERHGWITNVPTWLCTGEPEDPCPDPNQYNNDVFRVEWPEIEDEAAEEREEAVPSTWEIAVDQDLLILG